MFQGVQVAKISGDPLYSILGLRPWLTAMRSKIPTRYCPKVGLLSKGWTLWNVPSTCLSVPWINKTITRVLVNHDASTELDPFIQRTKKAKNAIVRAWLAGKCDVIYTGRFLTTILNATLLHKKSRRVIDMRNICCHNVLHNSEQTSNTYNVVATNWLSCYTVSIFCAKFTLLSESLTPGWQTNRGRHKMG